MLSIKNLLLLFCAFHVSIVFSDQFQYLIMGEQVMTGNGATSSACDISPDGKTVAIATPLNDDSGRVQVFAYGGGQWIQMGMDIDGESAGDDSGSAVSISSNGMIIAIAAFRNSGNGPSSGHVRVFSYDEDGSQWTQLGDDLDGENSYDYFGTAVSISSDGLTVAIGAVGNDENGSNSGHVRVYSYEGGQWIQMGMDIDGESAGDDSGSAVSISSNGMIVAIGAVGNGSLNGHVRVYSYDGGQWIQMGMDIDGESAGDQSGWAVSISSDGMIVAFCTHSGFGRVYAYKENQWTQLGSDLQFPSGVVKALTLSSDGKKVAFGAYPYSTNEPDTVYVYSYDEIQWNQNKSDIKKEISNSGFDTSLSISFQETSTTVAISQNDGALIYTSDCPKDEFISDSSCVEACPEGTTAYDGETVCVLIQTPEEPSTASTASSKCLFCWYLVVVYVCSTIVQNTLH